MQVSSLLITNINMIAQVDNMAALVPESTVYLALTNCLLMDFPSALGSISGLHALYVSDSVIRAV